MPKLDPIILNQFNMGGLADSDWSGLDHSMSKLIGLDLHSKPGLVSVRQALAKESSTVITEFCKFSVACSNGDNYWFSSESGKVWKESSGTYTLEDTIVPTSGSAAITGAAEYNGYIYVATASYLHRIAVADLSDWAGNVAENWATLTNSGTYHPMLEVNKVLFIGDAHEIHQVDDTTFTAAALDINQPHQAKALGQIGNDLLIGTEIANNVGKSGIYRWDTYSVSFFSFDPIPEGSVNAFLDGDNFTYVQAGNQGSIYIYNGEQLELYYKIPGDYSASEYATVHSDAVANLGGQILFGLSNGSGNPTDQGVYMLGRNSRNYPYVMDLSFPISERNDGDFVVSGIEIGSIIVRGFDLWVSWKNGSSYGVDKLDYTTKLDGAYMDSRYMVFDRPNRMTINEIIAAYQSMPANCDINIYTETDYSGIFVLQETRDDSDRNIKATEDGRQELNTLKLRALFTTSSNTAPTLESIAVTLDAS